MKIIGKNMKGITIEISEASIYARVEKSGETKHFAQFYTPTGFKNLDADFDEKLENLLKRVGEFLGKPLLA